MKSISRQSQGVTIIALIIVDKESDVVLDLGWKTGSKVNMDVSVSGYPVDKKNKYIITIESNILVFLAELICCVLWCTFITSFPVIKLFLAIYIIDIHFIDYYYYCISCTLTTQ